MKQFVLYDNISEFIQTFEDAKKKKKDDKEFKLLEDLTLDLDIDTDDV